MASTRELVVYILEQDGRILDWCQAQHGFTLEKARTADLTSYGDLVAEIIADGKRSGVVSQAQVQGQAHLTR